MSKQLPGAQRGSITFGPNGERHIQLGEAADVTTVVYLFALDARRKIWGVVERADAAGKGDTVKPKARRVINTINDWVGAKTGQAWTVKQEEQFARGAVLYHQILDAQRPAAKGAFETLKALLQNVYKTIKGLPIEKELSLDVLDAYREMMGGGDTATKSDQS